MLNLFKYLFISIILILSLPSITNAAYCTDPASVPGTTCAGANCCVGTDCCAKVATESHSGSQITIGATNCTTSGTYGFRIHNATTCDVLEAEVTSKTATNVSHTINVGSLPSGTYVGTVSIGHLGIVSSVTFTFAPPPPTETPTPGPTSIDVGKRPGSTGFNVKCKSTRETYLSIFDMCVDFQNGIGLIISWILILATILAGVRIGIASIQFVTSEGDPGKLQEAREALTDAFLGIVLLVSAWIILGYINATFPADWHIDLFKFAPAT